MRHGSNINPPNRFESVHNEPIHDDFEWDQEHRHEESKRRIEYLEDATQSIVNENNSPDIPFRYSMNPYRGCAHGCAYCYARPTHEYLGMNAGLDFETKIMVKPNAADLLRRHLAKPRWVPEPIVLSGVTDCYQPIERELQLTRKCLQVAADCKHPIGIITKNALVARDVDLLAELARDELVHVYLSITTLDKKLARDMEPRTSTPDARLRAISILAEAGVPTGVMVAPIIPGLNDAEMPQVLKAAKNAGARCAGYVLLRLPLTVEPVFREWLERTQPLRAERVLNRIRETRQGDLNDAQWGQRMVGSGEIADQIKKMFRVFKQQFGLDQKLPAQRSDHFVPPPADNGQLRLF